VGAVWWVALVLVAAVLAGCGAPPAQQPAFAEPPGAEDLDLKATAQTGILRGVVLDEAIRPVPNATVVLQAPEGPRATATGASGLFGFDGLPAGTYFIAAEKAGYRPLQVSAVVVAGDAAPPFVQLHLEPDTTYRAPYVQAMKVSGFIECTGSPVALCGIPNNYRPTACGTHPALCYDNVTSDSTLFWIESEGNTSFLQAEMVWTASSDLSRQLTWNHVAGYGCMGIDGTNNATHGPSPMVASMVPPEIRVPGGDPCILYLGVSAGPPDEAACLPVEFPLVNTVCLGAAFEQSFDLFVHAFYGYLPPEGWTFVGSGTPPQPA
jgi:Carboxypeptidase regulatory-like domain